MTELRVILATRQLLWNRTAEAPPHANKCSAKQLSTQLAGFSGEKDTKTRAVDEITHTKIPYQPFFSTGKRINLYEIGLFLWRPVFTGFFKNDANTSKLCGGKSNIGLNIRVL